MTRASGTPHPALLQDTGTVNLLASVRRHPLYILCKSSQGAVFLVNSRQRDFSCGPTEVGQALSRSYGRFFAEFLNEDSPVPLGLLALSTCGGLRYGAAEMTLEVFLGRRFIRIGTVKAVPFFNARISPIKRQHSGFAWSATLHAKNAKPLRRSDLFPSSLHRYTSCGGPEY